MKYDLKKIMSRAWEIKKEADRRVKNNKLNLLDFSELKSSEKAVFSICLEMAWEEAKKDAETITITSNVVRVQDWFLRQKCGSEVSNFGNTIEILKETQKAVYGNIYYLDGTPNVNVVYINLAYVNFIILLSFKKVKEIYEMSNLARIRKEKMLSQAELVKVSGVSKSVILKYESGERDINKASGATLLKIATALSCKIEDLLERGKRKSGNVLLFNYYCNYEKVCIEEENEWQEEHEGELHPVYGTWDCGEGSAREDFSNYAGLEEEITFEKMLELERRYE